MSLRDRVKQWLRMCGHALTSTVHDRIDLLERELQATRRELRAAKLVETDAALLEASIHIVENLHALAGRTIVETDISVSSPEAALTAFLYSHVPARAAVEAAIEPARGGIETDGGNRERTQALLRAGYEVYAFEAGQGAGKPVIARRNGGIAVASGAPRVAGIAIGTPVAGVTEGIPSDTPKEIGLMTLGCDPLPVVRKFGDRRACVVTADLQTDFEELVGEMRTREYYWHIVLYRVRERDRAHDADGHEDREKDHGDHNGGRRMDHHSMSYYANHPRALPNSCGSVFFFRDFRVFAEAQAWCAASLPRTYFKPQQA